MLQKAATRLPQVEALGSVIALAHQLLLHEPPGQPGPVEAPGWQRRGDLLSLQIFGNQAQLPAITGLQAAQEQNSRRRPIGAGRAVCTGRQAAVAATARAHKLAYGQQQSLLPATIALGHRLHPPELALTQFQPLPILKRVSRSCLPRRPHRPAEADPIGRIEEHQTGCRLTITPSPA